MMPVVLALALAQLEFPNENQAVATPGPPAAPVLTRSLLAIGGGTLAAGAALGISALLVGANPGFDPTFANAALGAMLVAGVSFSVHQAMGGRGEVLLALLFSSVVMAGAAGLATAIDGGQPLTPILTTAIGALPAAAAAVLGLELSTPQPRTAVRVALGPGVVRGTF
jgi:hypothetical protein